MHRISMPPRVIFHVDLDAFFAAVEQRDNPVLRGKPVVVGADPQGGRGRGVVATCSYEARRFGIHSAMPISSAYKKCPQAVFLRGSFAKYRQASDEVFRILYDFTPHIEPVSIDEAFGDITGSFHFHKTPYQTCVKIKEQIRAKVGLTASIGIAPLKMVAKIASDLSKPDGLLEVKPESVLEFLHPLPIARLWGVGPKTREALERLGIMTIGDIARTDKQVLEDHFGEHGEHLYQLANGIDPRDVAEGEEIKSVSHEHTFDTDTDRKQDIYDVMLEVSEKLSRRLRKAGLKGKTITVKIRLKGFKTYTRALTLSGRTNFTEEIYTQARRIFDQFYQPGQWIRLIGVRVSNFDDAYVADSLFVDTRDVKKENIHQALDTIKDKFGDKAIHRAR